MNDSVCVAKRFVAAVPYTGLAMVRIFKRKRPREMGPVRNQCGVPGDQCRFRSRSELIFHIGGLPIAHRQWRRPHPLVIVIGVYGPEPLSRSEWLPKQEAEKTTSIGTRRNGPSYSCNAARSFLRPLAGRGEVHDVLVRDDPGPASERSLRPISSARARKNG